VSRTARAVPHRAAICEQTQTVHLGEAAEEKLLSHINGFSPLNRLPMVRMSIMCQGQPHINIRERECTRRHLPLPNFSEPGFVEWSTGIRPRLFSDEAVALLLSATSTPLTRSAFTVSPSSAARLFSSRYISSGIAIVVRMAPMLPYLWP